MSTTKSEAPRVKATPLDKQYRAIGPAAIVAALICAPKKNVAGQSAKKAA